MTKINPKTTLAECVCVSGIDFYDVQLFHPPGKKGGVAVGRVGKKERKLVLPTDKKFLNF